MRKIAGQSHHRDQLVKLRAAAHVFLAKFREHKRHLSGLLMLRHVLSAARWREALQTVHNFKLGMAGAIKQRNQTSNALTLLQRILHTWMRSQELNAVRGLYNNCRVHRQLASGLILLRTLTGGWQRHELVRTVQCWRQRFDEVSKHIEHSDHASSLLRRTISTWRKDAKLRVMRSYAQNFREHKQRTSGLVVLGQVISRWFRLQLAQFVREWRYEIKLTINRGTYISRDMHQMRMILAKWARNMDSQAWQRLFLLTLLHC